MDVSAEDYQQEKGSGEESRKFSSEMLKAGEVYENPVTGERAVIRVGTDVTAGERLVVDLYVQPGGAVMGEHFHPGMEERFTVLRGQVEFRLAGREAIAEPGG
jgi:quercetin dioxygenase-like cupin family protein